MASPPIYSTLRGRLIIWIWKRLPISGRIRLLISWLCNLRWAVGVGAVIFNEAGEVLLLRHTYRRGGYEWGLPAGWTKGRESMERALARELREETGLTIAIERLVAVHSGYALPRMTVIYQGRIAAGTFRPSDEVAGYRFSRPDELWDIMPAERHAVRQALSGEAGPWIPPQG